jgi:hypothetical protein
MPGTDQSLSKHIDAMACVYLMVPPIRFWHVGVVMLATDHLSERVEGMKFVVNTKPSNLSSAKEVQLMAGVLGKTFRWWLVGHAAE